MAHPYARRPKLKPMKPATLMHFAMVMPGAIDIQTSLLSLEPGTEIVSSTSLPGEGGRIVLQVNQLNMSGATIQTTSTGIGSGDAGDIDITAQKNLEMTDSSISTSATQADGGNIKLTVEDTVYLLDSDISAKVQGGAGNGGNINIDPVFVVLNGSNITADAFGGNGGNIQIITGFFLATPDSSVTASSALGINGTVDINAPDADVSGSLTALPATFLDASALLAFPLWCAHRPERQQLRGDRTWRTAASARRPATESLWRDIGARTGVTGVCICTQAASVGADTRRLRYGRPADCTV